MKPKIGHMSRNTSVPIVTIPSTVAKAQVGTNLPILHDDHGLVVVSFGDDGKYRLDDRAGIHEHKNHAKKYRHQNDQYLNPVEGDRGEAAEHTLEHRNQIGAKGFLFFRGGGRSRRKSRSGFRRPCRRFVPGNFSSYFRLKLFLENDCLLFHFDPGLLQTLPVIGQRFREFYNRSLHGAEQSPAQQSNTRNQSDRDQCRRYFSPACYKARIRRITGLTAREIRRMSKKDKIMGESSKNVL